MEPVKLLLQNKHKKCINSSETVRTAYGNDIAEEVSILYGGSVKPENAKEIFSKPDVDGGLGGAALKSDDFVAIVNAKTYTVSYRKSGN
jgi:triosephosphate isomerase